MYTSKLLIDDAKSISELCIETKEQWLLWKELMRYSSEGTQVIKKKDDFYYEFNNLKISIENQEIIIKSKNNVIKKIFIKDFNNNSRKFFKEIIELSI
jgi:hypothetical protein